MGTSVHYLYNQAVECAKRVQMTDQERAEQMISRVFGNVHLEYPTVTRELVRAVVQDRQSRGAADGTIVR